MGLLDGDLTSVVYGAFSWLLLDGTIAEKVLTENGKGGQTESYPVANACKYAEDKVTKEMRQEPDFQDTDVALIILAQGVPFPSVGAKLTGATDSYQIMTPIDRDAARSHYVARGRKL